MATRFASHLNFTRYVALCAIALGLVACATPGPILTESVGTLRTGIGAAREQSRLAFENANKLARDQAVEAKLNKTAAVSIAEDDFPLAVSREAIAQWNVAFDVLDAYTASLQKLVSPQLSQGTGDALTDLGKQLQSGTTIHAQLPSGAAGAFATFGQALVQAHAEKSATDVMRQVDPAFTQTMAGMADAIGKDDHSGLRGTVHNNWEPVLAALRTSYGETPAKDRSARKGVLQQFLDSMDARDAQLSALSQLRTSLIGLGEAHSAAARGNHGEVVFWIDRINGWLDDVRRRADDLDKARGTK